MSRFPQQAERVVAGDEALQRRQHRCEQLRLPPRAESLRLPPRAAEQRVWLGAGAGPEHDGAQRAAEHDGAPGDGVIGESGPAGASTEISMPAQPSLKPPSKAYLERMANAPSKEYLMGQGNSGAASQVKALQRARSHARLTLQNVACKGVPGSSSSHAVGTVAGAEAGAEAAGAVGSGTSPGPFPLRPSLLRMPEVEVAVGLGGGAPQAARSGSPLAAQLAVSDATPLPASPQPLDRAAKRTSSIAVNRQQQLNALMALEEDSSDEGEHAAKASSHLDEDFEDPPEEAACSPTDRRLSVGQAMSSPI